MAMQRPAWDAPVLPQGAEKVRAVREMFDAIAPRYDFVNRLMTFRLDVRWRHRTVEELWLPRDSHVLVLDPERVRTRAHDRGATSGEFLGACWAAETAGEMLDPPRMGSDRYPVLGEAPGRYVHT